MKKAVMDELVDQAEALCAVYVGKNAPSEQWIETIRRLIELDKVVKKVRRTQKAVATRAALSGKD